jgi:Zn-dependent protease with chaperone function
VGLNSANRAFAGIVVVAAAVFGVFAGTACWIFSMVAYKAATDGLSTLTELGSLAALLLIALLVATNVLGVRSFRAQVRNTRRLSRWVEDERVALPSLLASAARAAHLEGRIDLVKTDGPFSFTYGMARPRVVVSSGLVASASREELAAVLDHERYHVANYDPLKVVIARSLPDSLFFLPALSELRGRYAAARELAADRQAIGRAGPGSLAGALYKVIAGPSELELGAVAAIGGDEALDARLNQLESGTEPPLVPISRSRLLASVGGAGVLAGSAVASFASFAPVMAKICTGR